MGKNRPGADRMLRVQRARTEAAYLDDERVIMAAADTLRTRGYPHVGHALKLDLWRDPRDHEGVRKEAEDLVALTNAAERSQEEADNIAQRGWA
jgi:hypothetical protein